MINAPFPISPDARIKTIEHALRCFRFGVASTLPLMGIPVALLVVNGVDESNRWIAIACTSWIPITSITLSLLAWSQLHQAQATGGGEWNPARTHLIWGRVLSATGVFFSLLLLLFFGCVLMGLLS